MMPKGFATKNIRQMDFNKGSVHGQKGITKRDTGVRQCPRIDNHPINGVFGCVQTINQRMLCIGLKKAQRNLIGITLGK